MKKILIFISLLLYILGCGEGEVKSSVYYVPDSDRSKIQTTSLESEEFSVTADYTIDHVGISEISALFVEGVALDIAISEDGRFVYIATGSEGLAVVDVSDPYNPKLISNLDTPRYVNSVTVVNSIAYVTYKAQNWGDYLSINAFDISNPYDVKFIGYYEGFKSNSHKLISKDGLVYFVDQKGFKVVSETDYTVVGRYDLFDTAYAFVMKENFAFIANGRNGLTILKAGDAPYSASLTNP